MALSTPESPLVEVLLADDDALYRRALARGFAQAGHTTHQAENRDSALEILRAQPKISHAVVDLQLGAGSGLELLRLIHQGWPQVRCLVLSAFCSTVVAVDSISMGAINCLPKSTSLQVLIAELSSDTPLAPLDEVPVPSLSQVEWDHIQRVLHDCNGNVSLAARKLGIHRQSLQRKLRRYAPTK